MTPSTTRDDVLGILYARMFQMWHTADEKSLKRKSDLLLIFQERMKAAGYASGEIQDIERKALRELDRLERPIETVFVEGWWEDPADDDGIDLRDLDLGGGR